MWSLLSRLTNTSWWWRSGILDCLPWVAQLLSLWTLKMSMIVLPCSPSPATTPQSRYVNNYLISIDRPNFFFNSWFIWVHGFKFWRDSLRAFGIMGMLFVIFQCCWWLSKTFFFLIWNLFEQRPPTGIVSFAANLENIFFWEISVGMYICRIYFFANIPCLTQFLLLTKVFFFFSALSIYIFSFSLF